MDPQQPFGPPDPYAQRPFAPPDPYAPPMPLAAPPRQSYVPFVVGGLVISLIAVVGLVTIASRVVGDRVSQAFPAGRSFSPTGETCDPVVHDPLPAEGLVHEEGPIDYGPRPPSLGVHNPVPLPRSPRVVPYDIAPALVAERAVHNLEHAYVVIWYDESRLPGRLLELLVERVSAPKVLAVPWTRGPLGGDAEAVLSAWGHRQSCSVLSLAVVAEFYAQYGGHNGDAPEKSAL